MMSQKSPATGLPHCPRCGASQRREARLCWLCGANLAADSQAARAALGSAAAQRRSGESVGGYSLASLMMFVTLVSVVLGLSTIAPGVGIPLGIVLLIVWARTAAVAHRRRARGMTVTWEDKVQLFLASFGVSLALIALMGVAGCAALLAACYACIVSSTVSEDAAWIVFWVVIIATMAGAVYLAASWILRRWRQDIGESR